jgi:septation ring formation regulator EzrA
MEEEEFEKLIKKLEEIAFEIRQYGQVQESYFSDISRNLGDISKELKNISIYLSSR